MPNLNKALKNRALRLMPLAALIWPACSFDDQVPETVVISCSAQEDCPPDFICRQDVGRCVQLENNDVEPPAILGEGTLSPDHPGKLGSVFTLSFQASEPLPDLDEEGGDNPKVAMKTAGSPPLLWKLESEEASDDSKQGAHYTFTYTADEEEVAKLTPYQPYTVTIIMQDESFNEGKVTVPPISFDFEVAAALE